MADYKNITIDRRAFKLEIADDGSEKQIGLMNRKSLPKNEGMIFLYSQRSLLSFWMKNTFIPLQIIFVNGCKIVDIQEMAVEKDPANPVNHYVSKEFADKAIEINSNSVMKSNVGQEIKELCN